jgi:hypothetical protein
MNAGRELDALVAEKLMGMGSQMTVQRQPDGSYVPTGEIWYDCPEFSTDIADVWQVVKKMHDGIDPAEMGRYQYLTLVCTGAFGERWAASFDFNLSHDWYEADVIVTCPFAAKAATAPLAICLAALKAKESL